MSHEFFGGHIVSLEFRQKYFFEQRKSEGNSLNFEFRGNIKLLWGKELVWRENEKR